jgi:hypothetical protein
MSLVGMFSIAIALTRNPRYMTLSGMSYWLIGPVMFIHGSLRGRRRKRLEASAARGAQVGLGTAGD